MNAPFPEKKLCTGPAHDGPVLLPVTDEFWYFHKTGYAAGKPTGRCKLCTNWDRIKGDHSLAGTIDCKKIRVYVQELALRCGSVDAAARYSGASDGSLRSALNGRTCRMQKRVAVKILGALSRKRQEDSKSGTLSPAFISHIKRKAEREGQINRGLEDLEHASSNPYSSEPMKGSAASRVKLEGPTSKELRDRARLTQDPSSLTNGRELT